MEFPCNAIVVNDSGIGYAHPTEDRPLRVGDVISLIGYYGADPTTDSYLYLYMGKNDQSIASAIKKAIPFYLVKRLASFQSGDRVRVVRPVAWRGCMRPDGNGTVQIGDELVLCDYINNNIPYYYYLGGGYYSHLVAYKVGANSASFINSDCLDLIEGKNTVAENKDCPFQVGDLVRPRKDTPEGSRAWSKSHDMDRWVWDLDLALPVADISRESNTFQFEVPDSVKFLQHNGQPRYLNAFCQDFELAKNVAIKKGDKVKVITKPWCMRQDQRVDAPFSVGDVLRVIEILPDSDNIWAIRLDSQLNASYPVNWINIECVEPYIKQVSEPSTDKITSTSEKSQHTYEPGDKVKVITQPWFSDFRNKHVDVSWFGVGDILHVSGICLNGDLQVDLLDSQLRLTDCASYVNPACVEPYAKPITDQEMSSPAKTQHIYNKGDKIKVVAKPWFHRVDGACFDGARYGMPCKIGDILVVNHIYLDGDLLAYKFVDKRTDSYTVVAPECVEPYIEPIAEQEKIFSHVEPSITGDVLNTEQTLPAKPVSPNVQDSIIRLVCILIGSITPMIIWFFMNYSVQNHLSRLLCHPIAHDSIATLIAYICALLIANGILLTMRHIIHTFAKWGNRRDQIVRSVISEKQD